MNTRPVTKTSRWLPGAVVALAIAAGACSSPTTSAPPVTSAPSGQAASLPSKAKPPVPSPSKGAIAIVSLGDSLTAGQGEVPERGYPARLEEALGSRGQDVATVVNLGRSGWDSQQLIDGGDGDRSQLVSAEEAIAQAKQEGKDVIATVLIGSNDLWSLYRDEAPTTAADERMNLDRYRRNMQRIVSSLRGAGARVTVGINDDQSKRPVMTDSSLRQNTFAGMTEDEVGRMSAQAKRYAEVVRDVAKGNDAQIADFLDAAFFRNPSTLYEDGVHPNARGYDEMAKVWLAAIESGR